MTPAAKLQTPADESTTTATATAPVATPNRGRRHRLWSDGDYCVFILAAEGDPLPPGALTKVPDSPHFESVATALKWIANSGDLLAGKQVAVFRGYRIMNLVAKTTTIVEIHEKPRLQVAGPETEDAAK